MLKSFKNTKRISVQGKYLLSSLVLLLSPIASLIILPVQNASASQSITEYSLPSGSVQPTSIVTSGSSMWYLDTNSSSGATLSNVTTSGTITDYSIKPSGDTWSSIPTNSTLGVDSSGNIWFDICAGTSSPGNLVVGYLNPSTDAVTTYTQGACGTIGFGASGWVPGPLVVDSNNNVWVAMTAFATGYGQVEQFTSTGSLNSTWTTSTSGYYWDSMTFSPNDSLWLTNDSTTQFTTNPEIDQLTLSSSTDTVTGMSSSSTPDIDPSAIADGPDGNLWFNEHGGIAKMTPGGTFTQYSFTSGAAVHFTSGPDGALWFTYSGNIGRVTTGGSITTYQTPTYPSEPTGITSGPDNALWFTEYSNGKIGRISAAPFFTEYSTSSGHQNSTAMVTSGSSMWYLNTNSSNQPYLTNITTVGTNTDYSLIPSGSTAASFTTDSDGLAVDSSGNIWFSGCVDTSGSWRMLLGFMSPSTDTMTTHQYTSFPCNSSTSFTIGAPTVDTSGNIWVYMHHGTSTGYGAVAEFNSSGTNLSSWSQSSTHQNWDGMVAGPNNSLWLVDTHYPEVDQLTLSSSTDTVTSMNTYSVSRAASSITVGPDGNLWFGGYGNINKMTSSGTITSYSLPSGGSPIGVTTGSDGALWFSTNFGKIDRATTSGSISEYTVPTSGAGPWGITSGPDNALWFAEYYGGKVGRLGY